MPSLKNQLAVVTGAGSGIGKGIANELSRQGAHVIIADINEENAYKAASEINVQGFEATACKLDVSNSMEVSELFNKLERKHGKIDILVNNAGIAGDPSLVDEMSDENWAKMMNVHVNGSFFCLREASRIMKKYRYGRIINMSSTAAVNSLLGFSHYSAAKYAIVGLTEATAKELAPFNITVNAIKPGMIRSALSEGILAVGEDRFRKATPVNRIGEPQDIAKVVSALVQPSMDFVTGTAIAVDGGLSIVNDFDQVVLEQLGDKLTL